VGLLVASVMCVRKDADALQVLILKEVWDVRVVPLAHNLSYGPQLQLGARCSIFSQGVA
jgi:hypothetical protein